MAAAAASTYTERRPWRRRPVTWRARAAGRPSPRVMHDLQVTADCSNMLFSVVRVPKRPRTQQHAESATLHTHAAAAATAIATAR